MNNPSYSRPEVVLLNDEKVIQFLRDSTKSRWLQPFMPTPLSLKQASNQLGANISSYSYWIKKLLAYGLIKIVFEKKRQGNPIKYYWAAAERFEYKLDDNSIERIILSAMTEYNSVVIAAIEQLLRENQSNYTGTFSYDEQGDFVIGVKRKESNNSIWQDLLKPQEPALLVGFRDIKLSFEDAKSLQKELHELMEKYQQKINLAENSYILQVGLAKA